jgi:hypothetical protein
MAFPTKPFVRELSNADLPPKMAARSMVAPVNET